MCNKGKNRINPIQSLEGSEAGQRNLDLSEPIMIVLNVEHALYPSSSFSFTSSFSSIIIKGKFCMNQSGKCGKYSGRRTLHVYLYIGSLDIFSVSHYFFFLPENIFCEQNLDRNHLIHKFGLFNNAHSFSSELSSLNCSF